MGIFSGLTNEGLEETQDRLGGFQPLETDAYDAEIKVAYAGKSDSGAQNVTIVAELENGREYRETIYVTNRKGENFFLNQNDQTKKVPLPGFVTIDDICLVTTEKPLAEQATEDKVVKIYDYESRQEVPTSVPVLIDLIGKKVTLGIGNQLVNKNTKDNSGNYVPTAETRTENVIEKVFHYATKMTVVEARNGKTEGEFYQVWVDRNKGQQRDRRKLKDGAEGGTAGRPGASSGPPASGASGGAPRKSLFGGNS